MHPRITAGILTYRSPAWLSFVLEGLATARNDYVGAVPYVVANDPTDEIAIDPRVDAIFRNPDPDEYHMCRVYRALNFLMATAPTELVVLLNSDMYVADYWLDALYEIYEEADGRAAVTGLLVESGRITSGLPEYVRDFGQTPQTFDRAGFRAHAAALRAEPEHWRPGKLYGPLLVSKTAFHAAGRYPIGNVSVFETGDSVLFEYLAALGYPHRMAMHSICYHVQVGEKEIDVD